MDIMLKMLFTNQWKSENLSMLKINEMKDDISVQAWT